MSVALVSAALSIAVLTAACTGSDSTGPGGQGGGSAGPGSTATAADATRGGAGEPTTAGAYRVTVETVEGTTPQGGTYTIELPRLAGPDPAVADRVNAAVDDYMREVRSQSSDSTLTLDAGDPHIGAEVLSLSFGGDSYLPGAAHPMKIAAGFVFDLRDGERVDIQDVFTDTTGGLRQLQPVVRAELESRFPGSGADVVTEPVASNYERFVVNRSGMVVIVVDLPTAVGPQSVLVPWDDIVNLVRPELVDVLRS